MTLLNRLDALMRETGLNKSQLAQRTKIPKTTVYGWYDKGYENMTLPTLRKLADYFGCTMEYLANGSDTIPETWNTPLDDAYVVAEKPTQENVCKLLDIPHVAPFKPRTPPREMVEKVIYTYPPAAGLPLYAESDFERIEFPADEVPRGADFGMHVSGDSMEPTIGDGSLIWIQKQLDIKDGEVGVFMLGDSAVCKRAHLRKDGRLLRLESDNPKYKPIIGEDLSDVRCVGKVLL